MTIRRAEAEWRGDLRQGGGKVALESGSYAGPFSFRSRFQEGGGGINPEELIAAAHASCFSMQLSAQLSQMGYPPQRIHTTARVHLQQLGNSFEISKIELRTEAQVPGLDERTFAQQASGAKEICPVSRLLAGAEIELEARLHG